MDTLDTAQPTHDPLSLEAKIEAILFFKGEAVTLTRLAQIVDAPMEEIVSALDKLEKNLTNQGRGIVLVRLDDEVSLGTSQAATPLIEKITKEELTRDLGKAGLETLSIIFYKGPVARRDIDYIRGVNSQFILRNLLIRGLIEKKPDPKDQRTFLYTPTMQLIQYMGLTRKEDLPEYLSVRDEITAHNAHNAHNAVDAANPPRE